MQYRNTAITRVMEAIMLINNDTMQRERKADLQAKKKLVE